MFKFGKSLVNQARGLRRGWRLGLIFAVCVVLFVAVPIPTRRFAQGTLKPRVSRAVYSKDTAQLIACANPATEAVSEGQELFRFVSTRLESEAIDRLSASKISAEQLELALRNEARHASDVEVATAEARVAKQQQMARSAQERVDNLTLRAPVSGRLIPEFAPPATGPGMTLDSPGATWCSTLQLGRTVPEGTLLATVCSDSLIAVVPLTARQLAAVAEGTPVRLRLCDSSRSIVTATVARIVQIDSVHPQPTDPAVSQAASAGYAAIVDIPSQATEHYHPPVGEMVDVVFLTRSQSLLSMAGEWLGGNLRLLAE